MITFILIIQSVEFHILEKGRLSTTIQLLLWTKENTTFKLHSRLP
uniref:Uncharacterized protein n=1 Tax=Anguilla anguilla TaxID=7936 RepID=A0A0E9UFR8_ANGAN